MTRVKLSQNELTMLNALATKSGMSQSQYLRALIRDQHGQLVQAGFLEPVSDEEHKLAARTNKFVFGFDTNGAPQA